MTNDLYVTIAPNKPNRQYELIKEGIILDYDGDVLVGVEVIGGTDNPAVSILKRYPRK